VRTRFIFDCIREARNAPGVNNSKYSALRCTQEWLIDEQKDRPIDDPFIIHSPYVKERGL
jgi:hypothetical protein